MKFQISKKDLLEMLTVADIATDPLNNYGYLITANKDNTITIQGNSISTASEITRYARVDEEGTINIKHPQLKQTLNGMPNGIIEVETDKHIATFTIAKYKSKYLLADIDSFPKINKFKDGEELTLSCEEFQKEVDKTVFAIDTSKNAKAIFTGINIHVYPEGKIRFAATNTKEMAVRETTFKGEVKKEQDFIVPGAKLNLITRQLMNLKKDEKDPIIIRCNGKKTAFIMPGVYIETNNINGQYPDITRAFPKNLPNIIKADTKTFLNAVRFVSPVSKETDYNTINFVFKKDTMDIQERSEEATAKTTIPIVREPESEDEFTLALKFSYISNILSKSDDTIFMHVNPGLPIKIEQGTDKNFVCVIAPMRKKA